MSDRQKIEPAQVAEVCVRLREACADLAVATAALNESTARLHELLAALDLPLDESWIDDA